MSAPLFGQVIVSGTAARLAAATLPQTVAYTLKAPISNVNPVFIGDSTVTTGTGFRMDPGDTYNYGRNDQHGEPRLSLNVSDYWAVGTAGTDVITWIATP